MVTRGLRDTDSGAEAESVPRGEEDGDVVTVVVTDAEGLPVSTDANDADSDSKLIAVCVKVDVSDLLFEELAVIDTDDRGLNEYVGLPVVDNEIRGLALELTLIVACEDDDEDAEVLLDVRGLAEPLTDGVLE